MLAIIYRMFYCLFLFSLPCLAPISLNSEALGEILILLDTQRMSESLILNNNVNDKWLI